MAGHKRTMTGLVFSDKMDKTIVVQVRRRVKDKRYHKYMTLKSRYKAHDENNECKLGDTVEIEESRPLSRDKRWMLKRILNKAEA